MLLDRGSSPDQLPVAGRPSQASRLAQEQRGRRRRLVAFHRIGSCADCAIGAMDQSKRPAKHSWAQAAHAKWQKEALGPSLVPSINCCVCNAVAVCPPDVRGRSGRRGSEGAARWRRLCLTALRTCRYGCTSRSAAAGGDPVSGWALPLPPRAPLPPLHVMQHSEGKHCSSNLIPPVIVLDSMLAHSQRILHTLHSSAAAFSPRTCPAPCPTATPSVSLPQALGQRGHQPQLPRPLHRGRVCEQQLRQRQRGR